MIGDIQEEVSLSCDHGVLSRMILLMFSVAAEKNDKAPLTIRTHPSFTSKTWDDTIGRNYKGKRVDTFVAGKGYRMNCKKHTTKNKFSFPVEEFDF